MNIKLMKFEMTKVAYMFEMLGYNSNLKRLKLMAMNNKQK